MIKIAMCDDDEAQLKILNSYINKIFSSLNTKVNIDSYTSGVALFNSLINNIYDVYILDIELDHESGINIAKKLNDSFPGTPIIFITGHTKYFIDVYDVRHTYLVLKSDLSKTLKKAVISSLEIVNQKIESKTIRIKYKNSLYIQNLNQLIYLENVLRKVRFHTDNNDLYAYASFETYDEINENPDFIQCHRSYIINRNHIRKITASEVLMSDGSVLPIGRNFRTKLAHSFYE